MPKNEDTPSASSNWWLLAVLIGGGGTGGLLIVGLMVWGVLRLFAGGGLYGPVIAQARPAVNQPVAKNVLPAEQIPAADNGWNVTPDGVPLASAVTSAVRLPDGDVNQVLFSDPAQARAAVVIAKKPLPAGPKVVVNNYPAYPLEWTQVDLKGGQVVASIPVGNSEPGAGPVMGRQVTNA